MGLGFSTVIALPTPNAARVVAPRDLADIDFAIVREDAVPEALRKSCSRKITTARYVTPLGRDIQHRGIMPDVVVNQNVDPALIDTPNDKQLAAAKAKLRALSQR